LYFFKIVFVGSGDLDRIHTDKMKKGDPMWAAHG
jgi:hypothetical protein